MAYSKEQRKIIRHNQGAGLVVAGPGCGKSFTLLGVIQQLIKQGTPPNRILLLTYNEHTQQELRGRIKKAIDPDNSVNVYTFHAFGLEIISQYSSGLGFTGSLSVVNKPIKTNSKTKKLGRNQVDFDDMLAMPVKLFKENPKILKAIAKKYSYLLVDELQDINKKQAEIIVKLAKHIPASLMVGDKKQTIYGFRGASNTNWDYLIKQLKPVQYTLTTTFRLPEKALPFINSFAKEFSDDPRLTSSVKGKKPSLYRFGNPDDAADFLAKEISTLLKKGVSPDQIACLGRTRIPLLQLKVALSIQGIETVESYSPEEEVDEKWSKIFRALVFVTQWTHNPGLPVPIKSITRVVDLTILESKQLQDPKQLSLNVQQQGIKALKLKKSEYVNDQAYRRSLSIRKAIENAAESTDVEAGLQLLIDALLSYIKLENKQWAYFQRELGCLKTKVRDKSWQDVKPSSLQTNTAETGTILSTVHGAKGKEWEYVFLMNVVDGEYPFHKSTQKHSEFEIFYTAITRHKVKLYLLQTPLSGISRKSIKINRFTCDQLTPFVSPHIKHLDDKR